MVTRGWTYGNTIDLGKKYILLRVEFSWVRINLITLLVLSQTLTLMWRILKTRKWRVSSTSSVEEFTSMRAADIPWFIYDGIIRTRLCRSRFLRRRGWLYVLMNGLLSLN